MPLLKLRQPDIALFGTYMLRRGAAVLPAPSVAPHNLASNLLTALSQHCNKGKNHEQRTDGNLSRRYGRGFRAGGFDGCLGNAAQHQKQAG